MTHVKPPFTSFNKYFLVPFILWLIAGGIAQICFDKQTLFAFFNTHHRVWLDGFMYGATQLGEGIFITIVLLLPLAFSRFKNWWYLAAALLCNVVPALLVQWVKSAVNAPRPLLFFTNASWIHTLPEWPRLMHRSFPSGHTSAAFALFCFLAFILTPRYKWFGLLFFFLALLVAYTRMYLAAHFFVDVYVGSIIGVLFTILVLLLMRRHPQYFFSRQKQ